MSGMAPFFFQPIVVEQYECLNCKYFFRRDNFDDTYGVIKCPDCGGVFLKDWSVAFNGNSAYEAGSPEFNMAQNQRDRCNSETFHTHLIQFNTTELEE